MKTNERDDTYVFEDFGALQSIMHAKIDSKKSQNSFDSLDTSDILSAIKYYQSTYDP